jgi:putative ABC transport system permease protein
MENTYDVSMFALFVYLFLVIIPLWTFRWLHIKLSRELIISVIRMTVQLLLVGVYMEYIFKLNHPLINFAWIIIMLIVANVTILNRSGLKLKKVFTATFPAYIFTIMFCLVTFLIVFKPSVLLEARYLIPLSGMILGNLLRGNIIGLDRFFSELRKRETEYIQYISLGATRHEATRSFLREAYKAALAPQLGSIATMGLVSLPGMMTGQILGGSSPAVAIKYQIIIMIAIFITISISVLLSLILSRQIAFDEYSILREDIFQK